MIGRGEPLVLIMGLGVQLIHWPDGFCHMLADRGFQVIRFDNRDAGLSTKLDHLPLPPINKLFARRWLGLPVQPAYTLSDMARDVVGLLDRLGLGDAHIAGASMGGMIAQTLAIEHPARVRTLTSLMSSPGGRRFAAIAPSVYRALLGPPIDSRDEAVARARACQQVWGSRGFSGDEPRILDTAARGFERCYAPRGFVRQFSAVLASRSRLRALSRLSMPVLVVHGTVDRLVPPWGGVGTARAIRGARLRLIDGMGHDLPAATWPLITDAMASLALG